MNGTSNADYLNTIVSGSKIPCPSCNSLNAADALFCSVCGAKMAAAVDSWEASAPEDTSAVPAFATVQQEAPAPGDTSAVPAFATVQQEAPAPENTSATPAFATVQQEAPTPENTSATPTFTSVQQNPAEANFCPNCGASVNPGSVFCGNCGSKLSLSIPQTAPNGPGTEFNNGPIPGGNEPGCYPGVQRPAPTRTGRTAEQRSRRFSVPQVKKQPNDVQEDAVVYEEPSKVFADGLPEWDMTPPEIMVRKKRRS